MNKNLFLNDDCFNILKTLDDKSVDLIIADPPYNITSFKYDKIKFDIDLFFKEALRVLKDGAPLLVFAAGSFHHKLIINYKKHFRYEIVWNKVYGTSFVNSKIMPMTCHEYINVFSNKGKINYYWKYFKPNYDKLVIDKTVKSLDNQSRMLTKAVYKKDIANTHINKEDRTGRFPTSVITQKKHSIAGQRATTHPSKKPHEVIKQLLHMYSKENDFVLDPFSGSGVVFEECLKLNRTCIATELDPFYYNQTLKNFNTSLNEYKYLTKYEK